MIHLRTQGIFMQNAPQNTGPQQQGHKKGSTKTLDKLSQLESTPNQMRQANKFA